MKKFIVLFSMLFLLLPLLTVSTDNSIPSNYSNIEIDKIWTIKLNDQIDASSVQGNIYLLKGDEKINMNIEVKNNVMTAKATKDLQYNTTYTLVVTNNIKSVDGDNLNAAFNTSFTTEKAKVASYKSFPSEYGFTWHMASKDYANFYLTGVDNYGNIVAGYDTRKGQTLFGIQIGAASSTVTSKYGKPVEKITKNNTNYVQRYINKYDDTTHGTYIIDGKYVTFFYDVHKNNIVRSITWVDEHTEAKKTSFFATGSNELRKGFEDLMIELINQARVADGLNALIYTPEWNYVGRAHSQDMIDHNYFAHVNLKGDKARERMASAGISYQWYGENLAYGQYSAIYAHEALMNSLGHRENILRERFTHAYVGVAFKSNGTPYFTINFYQK